MSENTGIQFQLSSGKVVRCALNLSDAAGGKKSTTVYAVKNDGVAKLFTYY